MTRHDIDGAVEPARNRRGGQADAARTDDGDTVTPSHTGAVQRVNTARNRLDQRRVLNPHPVR